MSSMLIKICSRLGLIKTIGLINIAVFAVKSELYFIFNSNSLHCYFSPDWPSRIRRERKPVTDKLHLKYLYYYTYYISNLKVAI